jgi:signal transduction histidine kinase/DNA-binding NarL/FixJ family response regulator
MIKSPLHILIAEDEISHSTAIQRRLENVFPKARIQVVASISEYQASIAGSTPSLAIIDLNLPDGRTFDLLTAPAVDAPFPVIIMTSFGSEQLAVDAIKAGALDYIVKSPESFASIDRTIGHALREWKLIQEKKLSQEQLRESERFFRATLDALSAHIAILDDSGTIISVNRAWRKFSRNNGAGDNLNEGINYLTVCDGTHSPSCAGGAEMAEGIRAIIRGDREEFYLEYPCHSPNEQRWFHAKATNFSGDLSKKVVVAHENITERKLAEIELQEHEKELDQALKELKEAQARVVQQEKMASIGQLAAGVAHEINNPMGYITSNLNSLGKYAEKLAQYIELQEQTLERCADEFTKSLLAEMKGHIKLDFMMKDFRNLIAESREGSTRVSKIVQDLKSFSRAEGDEAIASDLNACIESTINVVHNEIKYVAELQLHLGEIPAVVCRPQQIGQVVMNLLVNAAHSISENGVITLTTKQVDDAVEISVADNGSGISPENMQKIFEPFFTTKESGKGTGLGLAISCDIIRKHGGELLVQSELGKGSTFIIRLPIKPEIGA